MDIQSVLTQLRQEASRIEDAIAALVGLESSTPRRGRPPKAGRGAPAGSRKRRTMSAAARAKIAAAQRARWAKQKGHATPKKAAGRGPMSAAARKKLSRMMKARWAAKKKAA